MGPQKKSAVRRKTSGGKADAGRGKPAPSAKKPEARKKTAGRTRAKEGIPSEAERRHSRILSEMPQGYCYTEILYDSRDRACDYRFLEANDAFFRLTGLKRDEVIGRTVTKILPGIEKDPADWIGRAGRVDRSGGAESFELFSTPLGRWYRGTIMSHQPRHTLTLFEDITQRRRAEQVTQARLRLLQYATHHSLDELIEKTSNEMEALTDSRVGFYHFIDEDQEGLTLQNWSTRTQSEFCKAAGKGSHYPISQAGDWVDCFHQRRPVIHNDVASLAHPKGMPEGHAEVVRELVVPIVRGDKIRAILGVGNKPTDYTEQDVASL